MALAAKMKNPDINVYTLLGDGEIEEGECWEAFMFANHYKLDNLCIMIDVNGLQIDGPTAKVMNSEPLDQKMDAFGFNTIIATATAWLIWSRHSSCLTAPMVPASRPASCCTPPRAWA